MKRVHSKTSEQRAVLSVNATTNSNRGEAITISEPRLRSINNRVSLDDLRGKSKTQLVIDKFEVPLVPMETLKIISRVIHFNDMNNWMTTCKATYWAANQSDELRRAPKFLSLANCCYQGGGRLALERLLYEIVDQHGFYNQHLLIKNSERLKALMTVYALTISLISSHITFNLLAKKIE